MNIFVIISQFQFSFINNYTILIVKKQKNIISIIQRVNGLLDKSTINFFEIVSWVLELLILKLKLCPLVIRE